MARCKYCWPFDCSCIRGWKPRRSIKDIGERILAMTPEEVKQATVGMKTASDLIFFIRRREEARELWILQEIHGNETWK